MRLKKFLTGICWSRLIAFFINSEKYVKAVLRPDGSAYITQIWSMDADDGTEFYLVLNNSGYLSITDFSVSDQNLLLRYTGKGLATALPEQ